MSDMKEQVASIRKAKQEKNKLIAYRIIAKPKEKYKVVFETKEYMNEEHTYEKLEFTTLKEAIQEVVKRESDG